MRIWTIGYFPWILGGDVKPNVMADVEVDGPHDLGKGYIGYRAASPSGKTYIAESETGAIIGGSLSMVRADIADADEEVMRKQIANAHERLNLHDTRFMTPADFWQHMKAD